jgi:glycosyltransferase involved in cell wall biosynthesis
MKIVFLSFYSGYIHRGMETVVHELSLRLSKNHQVTVFQAGPKLKNQTYNVVQIPLKMKWPEVSDTDLKRKFMLDYYYRQIGLFTFRVLKILKQEKVDILFPVNGGWMSGLSRLFCRLNNCKLIIAGQAGIGWDDRWNLMQKPDLFIALNHRNADWAKSIARKAKIVIINNGVDLAKFKIDGKKIDLKLEKPIILCVAANQRYKRVKETILAVSRLKKGSLLLIRGGDGKIDLNRDLGNKLLKSRFLCKSLTHDQMPAIYRSCDLFTMVSEPTEAFGLVYVEAMASGLGVVATDDNMRQEIIGSAGIFVKDPADSINYAAKLKLGLENKWGNIPRKQAQKFDWDKIAKQYEFEFEKLIK